MCVDFKLGNFKITILNKIYAIYGQRVYSMGQTIAKHLLTAIGKHT